MEIYIYLLVIFFIYLLLSKSENFEPLNYNIMDGNKLGLMDIPNIPDVIELEKLPLCQNPIDYFYGYNQNYIWNNGKVVNIDMLRQISRNYLIFNNSDRFQLRALRFKKSNILNNGEAYLLHIELIHSGATGMCDFNIIIPLEFSMTPELKLLKKSDIPQYKCCGKTFGKVIKHDLKEVTEYLQNTEFKRYNINRKQHLLVSKPAKISVDLGLDILNKLKSKNENKISQKSSWLEKDFLEL